ncbi:hypothetical protein JTE90_013686, partial [Oedothorax gibbosus]
FSSLSIGSLNIIERKMRSASQLLLRGFILFFIGMLFTFVLNILQNRRTSNYYKTTNSGPLLSSWWLPLICGSGSAFVGLIYPCLKNKGDHSDLNCQEWSHVLRCVAMFVGINEACTKVDFPSNTQLSVSLGVLSIGLWWYCDRTKIGFGMGVIVAALATLLTQMLVYHRVCVYTEREFLYVRSWLPCVVFSGGITVANIGKQLALNDFSDGTNKSHAE